MKRDLYKELGLPRNATKDEVKRAYRRRAKKCHPDKQGQAEQFLAVQLAYDTLSDDDKRAHYDRTGDTKHSRVGTLPERAICELARLFVQLIETMPDLIDIAAYDFVARAKSNVRDAREEVLKQEKAFRKRAERFRKVAERFSVKGEIENFPAEVMRSKAQECERNADAQQEAVALMEEGLKVLDLLSYRVDEKQKTSSARDIMVEELAKQFGIRLT